MAYGAITGAASATPSLHRLPPSTARLPLQNVRPAYSTVAAWNTVMPLLQWMPRLQSGLSACWRQASQVVSRVAALCLPRPQAELALHGAAMAAGVLDDSPLAGLVASTPEFTNVGRPLQPMLMGYVDSVVDHRKIVRNGGSRTVHLGPVSVSLDHNFNNNGILRVTVVRYDSLGVQEHKDAGFDRTTRAPKATESFALASAPFAPPSITIDGTPLVLTGVAEQRRMLNGRVQVVYTYKADIPVADLAKDVPIVIGTGADHEELLLEGTKKTVNVQRQLQEPSRHTIP